ncbi:hypothetical protein QBC46DRAFT_290101 [Diplogelasinospora grovesii]|uniref:Uncharacterized protein n=1 Tax=Diplogelasinospora grovesii TaxID=303347 RepID=A0AAN6S414_9PEZI|nr:hypothetical protein QBC46DRAFT_290101 [Diplogelasinospora grovesii]
MGVQGLWTVVQPCARPTNLATLNRKRLAVDASIWIYQFLKAVRDKEGNALRNSHVVGFFRRICKLLWFGIRPVFVFDGGAPALKRATLQGRRRRREGRREDAVRTAGKLLAVQMQRLAEEEETSRKQRAARAADRATDGAATGAGYTVEEEEQEQEQLPDMDNIVYADELGMSQQERQKSRKFYKKDAYHLPELENGIEAMGKPDDPRIMSVEELEEYARQFHNGEDINLYDFSKIDFDGEFFKSLPPADRYNILNAARIRSRLRMGLSKEQLNDMFPDRMAFSRFQIERVRERNKLTQRLMYEMGMTGTDLTVGGGGRVAGERNREYILVKNEGAEGGWALGVVSREKDRGEIHQPIDVDALDFQFQGKDDEDWEDEDEEFEDVPIEGLNRLPKLNPAAQEEEVNGGDEDALFVENDADLFGDDVEADEDEDLNRAIAMSLENQFQKEKRDGEEEDEEEFEDVPVPEWTQKAVEASKPIASSSGRIVAHIVNNRANAAVPKARHQSNEDSDSDSDVDLQTALAAARKKNPKPAAKPVQKPVEKAPLQPNVKNPFELPFEKLDWRSMFSQKPAPSQPSRPLQPAKEPEKPRAVEKETGDLEAESDDDAGGFVRERSETQDQEDEIIDEQNDDAPRELPPWLADNTTDIRDSMRKQQELDQEMNAEDGEAAREEEYLFQRRHNEIVEIESSDDNDSDIEIIDAPPLPAAKPPPKQPAYQEPGASLPSLDDLNPPEQVETPVQETKEAAPRSPSPEEEEEEFEDVALPTQQEIQLSAPAPDQEEVDAALEAELFGDADGTPSIPLQYERSEGIAAPQDDVMADPDPDAPAPEEFDDISDPEEEELMAQLAEEAEEHARFASQLNNKPQAENQVAYEQELKALRNQQKKDRRDADEVTQIMVTECQALLKLFGIPYISAPMEAEAQCAELVRLGLVDGIVTDDSDIFLFGGTRVYKNMFNSNKFVECYLAADLEKDLSLSRESLISLAQLLGSDYTEGLPGVGPVTALEILSEFPGENGLSEFKEWWTDVQVHNRPKEADAGSKFRRKFRKSQATKLFLPVGFPSPAVVDAYLHPEVDSSPEQFLWGVPDLEGLRQFLMATIGWSQERTDEVLVPVIKDMNKREMEGTQSNITRYFEGSVGSGTTKDAFAPRQRVQGSKRMAEAVNRLRGAAKGKKSGGGGGGGGGLSMDLPVMIMAEPKPKGTRKRKTREATVVQDDDDGDGDGNDADEEEQNGNGTAGARGKGKGEGKGKGKGKRSKASAELM